MAVVDANQSRSGQIIVQGGAVLEGQVSISGAKNAVLPLMASSILSDSCVIENVPNLSDVGTMTSLLNRMGAKCIRRANELVIDTTSLDQLEAPEALVRTMRASFLVLGPLLTRYGTARVSLPGGCAIGARLVDLSLKGLTALGAACEIHEGYIEAKAPSGGLVGAEFTFERITVSGTENVLMAAVLAKGTTVLHQCAMEPEIVNLCEALITMGASIEGVGTRTLTIHGQKSLKSAQHLHAISDRIEAGSYLIAAVMTQGSVRALGARAEHLVALLETLKLTGAEVTTHPDWIEVSAQGRPRAVSIETCEHPGFHTDLQAQMCALNTIADGKSEVIEHIFENRFMHCQELMRMNAKIDIQPHRCLIQGVDSLEGASVRATDLRGGFALVAAGLVAKGQTRIDQAFHLDRGYERLEEKLQMLGANLYREG